MSSETKTCQNCQKEFIIEPEDFEFYKKINVPPPTWCPECRMIRRMMFRNERSLYKRKCDFSGKEIFSLFSKESKIKVYDKNIWYSDNCDPMEYGKDYDWNKPFFTQIFDLMLTVPLRSRASYKLVNSDFCDNCANLKNCYLVFNSGIGENCLYSSGLFSSRECVDCLWVDNSELCYESFFLRNCYRVFFSVYCEGCRDVWFSKNCINCTNCIGCVGLKNKQYYIFNKPYSKSDYFKKLEEFNSSSFQEIIKIKDFAEKFWVNFPIKFMYSRHNNNVFGEYITNSKNVFNCYLVNQAEDCKYCQDFANHKGGAKDCYDYTVWGENSQFVYESVQVGDGIFNIKFCFSCYPNCQDLQYCIMCESSSHLFGCIGLRHKQYCILNKQYTKEEYEKLVPKIIEHMNKMPYIDKKGRVYKYGEFFPPELSPFSYNETIAQEYFPLTKEEALEKGYSWKNPEERNIKPDIYTKDLPDHIKDTKDDIIGKIIQCAHAKIKEDGTLEQNCNEQCTTAFKIIPQELEFYRKMNLPLPRLCPNCRHYQRIKQRNPLKLWKRKCMCGGQTSVNGVYKNTIKHFHQNNPCPNEFYTTYSPERPEIVYCEECYNSEVV